MSIAFSVACIACIVCHSTIQNMSDDRNYCIKYIYMDAQQYGKCGREFVYTLLEELQVREDQGFQYQAQSPMTTFTRSVRVGFSAFDLTRVQKGVTNISNWKHIHAQACQATKATIHRIKVVLICDNPTLICCHEQIIDFFILASLKSDLIELPK